MPQSGAYGSAIRGRALQPGCGPRADARKSRRGHRRVWRRPAVQTGLLCPRVRRGATGSRKEMNRLFIFSLGLVAILMPRAAHAIGQTRYILHRAEPGAFPVVQGKTAAAIYTDAADWPGVARAAADLSADIGRVTGIAPALVRDAAGVKTQAIIVGTIGRSPVVDQLIRERKLDVSGVAGKWEAFVIQVVALPFPGVSSALAIAGSDKRGTIYGVYDLSEQIGVSPWYFWADVPAVHRDALYVKLGRYIEGPPAVKYRGIFLNDEAPALSGWVKDKFGMASVTNRPGLPGDVEHGRRVLLEGLRTDSPAER